MNSQGRRVQKNAQTRIGGEICSSDLIMHKGHLTLRQCTEKKYPKQTDFILSLCLSSTTHWLQRYFCLGRLDSMAPLFYGRKYKSRSSIYLTCKLNRAPIFELYAISGHELPSAKPLSQSENKSGSLWFKSHVPFTCQLNHSFQYFQILH